MPNKSAIILDDHLLFAQGFLYLLESTKIFETVSFSHKICEIKVKIASRPDSYLFTDFLMPNIDVQYEIKNLKAKFPNLKIIVVSSVINPGVILQIRNAGAHGFLSKSSKYHDILKCIKKIEESQFFINKNLEESVLNHLFKIKESTLTNREYEILQHINAGETIEQTAQIMNLSFHTVVAHRRNMMEKLKVNNVNALLKITIELGIAQR